VQREDRMVEEHSFPATSPQVSSECNLDSDDNYGVNDILDTYNAALESASMWILLLVPTRR
jgi:hypothetical protein